MARERRESDDSGTALWNALQVIFPQPKVVWVELPGEPLDDESEAHMQGQWAVNKPLYRDTVAVDRTAPVEAVRAELLRRAEQLRPGPDAIQALREKGALAETADAQFAEGCKIYLRARQRIRDEYTKICSFLRVSRVAINIDSLVVDTKDLVVITVDGSEWDIGPWRIEIPRTRSADDLRCYSLRTEVLRDPSSGWIHPHVSGRNTICFGNAYGSVCAALMAAEYDVVVELVLAILEGGRAYDVNHEDEHGYSRKLRYIGHRIR